ncbi:hypothetical protein [Sphingomonas oligophenolica]|nr:hypothetical protein [Sphingomonas oligophenolica]
MLSAVAAGILASLVVEALLALILPGLRGGAAIRWTGNVVSVVVALAIYNLVVKPKAP